MYKYPTHILPQCLFRKIRSKDIPRHACFVRTILPTDAPKSETDIRRDKHKYTQAKEFVKGLSVNLVDMYRARDVRFKVLRDFKCYSESWVKGKGLAPQEGEFTYDPNRTYIGLIAKEIISTKFNVRGTQNFTNSPTLAKIAHLVPLISLKIEHAPTLCNFWHFNIFMYTGEGQTNKLDINNKLGIDEEQITKIARIMAQSQIYENIFVMPKNIKRCNLPKKSYKLAPTKHNKRIYDQP